MKKIISLLVTFSFILTILSSFTVFKSNAATVLPTDVGTPRSGCVFLGVEGKYIVQIDEALNLINKIRQEACNEGVINPVTGKPLKKEDYVPIKWSADLEYVARIRAAEACITMDHARLNGESIWGVTGPGGVSSRGEVIAWNFGETMTTGINQWYEEKSAWVNSTAGAVTGHYTSMINPDNRYVGLAAFCSSTARYYNTTVGEFSGSLSELDSSRGKATGSIVQTVEVQKNLVSYELVGTDTLSVRAAVTTSDYWSNKIQTSGLVLLGSLAGNIQWSSSDNSKVTVSNGKLTVKSCGSAVITAKLTDGSTAKKTVTFEHSYKTTTTDATCKAEGKVVNTCTVCGDTKTQVIPKTNSHSFGGWSVTKVPTVKENGLETRTCSVCGAAESRAVYYEPPATSSAASDSTDSSDSSSDDDESSSESDSDETSSDESGADESGSESAGGETSSESGADEAAEGDPEGTSSDVNSSDPSTGSEGAADKPSGKGGMTVINIVLIAGCVLLVCAAAGAGAYVYVRKKKKE